MFYITITRHGLVPLTFLIQNYFWNLTLTHLEGLLAKGTYPYTGQRNMEIRRYRPIYALIEQDTNPRPNFTTVRKLTRLWQKNQCHKIIVLFKFIFAVPLHAMEALGGGRYSSYSFSTSALDGGKWSASCPGRALASGKGPAVPIVQEAGWVPEPVWTQRLEAKSFRLCRGSNLDRLVDQPDTKLTELPDSCNIFNTCKN
jgi:hypothetical protein